MSIADLAGGPNIFLSVHFPVGVLQELKKGMKVENINDNRFRVAIEFLKKTGAEL
jgi:hypothetical protein